MPRAVQQRVRHGPVPACVLRGGREGQVAERSKPCAGGPTGSAAQPGVPQLVAEQLDHLVGVPRPELGRVQGEEPPVDPGGGRFRPSHPAASRAQGLVAADDRLQAADLGRRHGPPGRGQPVVPPSLVVELGIGSFVGLLDQPVVQEPADRRVDPARPQPGGAVRDPGDLRHDRVAVPLLRPDGEEHEHRRARQRAGSGAWSIACMGGTISATDALSTDRALPANGRCSPVDRVQRDPARVDPADDARLARLLLERVDEAVVRADGACTCG